MGGILRRDGQWTIYRVEVLLNLGGPQPEWSDATGAGIFEAKIPIKRRFIGMPHDGKHREPFRSFSASGRCWRETGIFGSFDFDTTHEYFLLLAKFNPDYRFRLVRHEVSQARVILRIQDPIGNPEKIINGA